ncbi:MAG: branched-chain amino acid ABC transporter permease [Roseovarius sp.]
MAEAATGTSFGRNALLAVVLTACAVAFPFFGPSNYVIGQFTLLFIWVSVVVQWNLVFGFAGIMTLGQVATFAVGAYATAMIALYLPVPFWLALLLSAPVAVLFNLFLGLITLRMRGDYVAIVTLAVAVLLSAIVVNDTNCFRMEQMTCYPFTGGSRGLVKYGDMGWKDILGFKYRYLGDYYLALTVLFFGFIFALVVISGPYGLAFRAIRDNESYARARGVAFRKYQLMVFALSAVACGLAGGVYAGYLKTVGSTLLDINLLIFLLSMMIVGGRGTVWGPVIGGAVLMYADSVLQSLGGWRTGGLALVTILFILFYPGGIAGAVGSLFGHLKAKMVSSEKKEPQRGLLP